MAILNLSSKTLGMLFIQSGRSLFLLLCTATHLYSGILPIFNPLATSKKSSATLNIQGFLANDPVSIKAFSDDWGGDFTPRSGDNIAIRAARIDIGTHFYDTYYMGYFYHQVLLGTSNRGFTDFFHAVKNSRAFSTEQHYTMDLKLEGIEAHGILLSKSLPLIKTKIDSITFGASAYLSFATDMQEGSLQGKSRIDTEQNYHATASADYYYMENLLYNLDVAKPHSIGYGFHFGLHYTNRPYGFDIQIIANDLAARSHWNNLPFSHIDLETSNEITNERGHTEYNPTISGLETYREYTKHIMPRYQLEITKYLPSHMELKAGIESIDTLNIPYITLSKQYNNGKKLAFLYEHRFGSKGIRYQDDNFTLSLFSNGLSCTSAVGFSGSYNYHF